MIAKCSTRQRTLWAISLALVVTSSATAATRDKAAYEVWVIDQSDTRGLDHGGTLYIFAGKDLAGGQVPPPGSAVTVDLGGAAAALCREKTGANPVARHGAHRVKGQVSLGLRPSRRHCRSAHDD